MHYLQTEKRIKQEINVQNLIPQKEYFMSTMIWRWKIGCNKIKSFYRYVTVPVYEWYSVLNQYLLEHLKELEFHKKKFPLPVFRI